MTEQCHHLCSMTDQCHHPSSMTDQSDPMTDQCHHLCSMTDQCHHRGTISDPIAIADALCLCSVQHLQVVALELMAVCTLDVELIRALLDDWHLLCKLLHEHLVDLLVCLDKEKTGQYLLFLEHGHPLSALC